MLMAKTYFAERNIKLSDYELFAHLPDPIGFFNPGLYKVAIATEFISLPVVFSHSFGLNSVFHLYAIKCLGFFLHDFFNLCFELMYAVSEAIAQQATASPRPTGPRPSLVLALMLTAAWSRSSCSLRFFRMAGL